MQSLARATRSSRRPRRICLRDLQRRNGARSPRRRGATGNGARSRARQSRSIRKVRRPNSKLFSTRRTATSLKEQLCDIGRRLWQRAYVDGNGGNIAIRVGEDIALCTPTLVSKGFMKPEDMCLVDFEGNQLAGAKKRTSEILMHLQIMKRQPKAVATCHCHPPYSTGFAVAGLVPPTCMIPEYEVFASVAIAPYRTPGTPEMGKLVADLVDKHNTILMANHGVVSWSHNNVEDAYFKMEILEAYCRTVLVTAQLGKPAKTMTAGAAPGPAEDQAEPRHSRSAPRPEGMRALRQRRVASGRHLRRAGEAGDSGVGGYDAEAEAAVQAITDQIMAAELKINALNRIQTL